MKKIKNYIYINYLITVVYLSLSITLHADSIKVATPYGEMHFSDDGHSTLVLKRFSKFDGDYRTDSLNTRAIIDVCNVADGALSEIMDHICLEDFSNKPSVVIDIYAKDKKVLDKYIDFIACGLCIADDSRKIGEPSNPVDELAEKTSKAVEGSDKLNILSDIISVIKSRYIKFKADGY